MVGHRRVRGFSFGGAVSSRRASLRKFLLRRVDPVSWTFGRTVAEQTCSSHDLVSKKAPAKNRLQPNSQKLQRDGERHLRIAARAIAECDWNFAHAQLPSAPDNCFESDFESGRRWLELQQPRTRNGEEAAHRIVCARQR